MGKIIFILLTIGIIYMLFKKKQVDEKEEINSNDLIQCDICGTFYPQEEISKMHGKNICKECNANS